VSCLRKRFCGPAERLHSQYTCLAGNIIHRQNRRQMLEEHVPISRLFATEVRSKSRQSLWYLWRPKWHWGIFFSKHFAFSLSIVILPLLLSSSSAGTLVHSRSKLQRTLSHPTARIKERALRRWRRRVNAECSAIPYTLFKCGALSI
jgi:hypothetical protein